MGLLMLVMVGCSTRTIADDTRGPKEPIEEATGEDQDDSPRFRILKGTLDDEPTVFVATDTQVLLVYRARDFVGLETHESGSGAESLWVVSQSGGPGTCVWSQMGEIYVPTVGSDGSMTLALAHTAELGGYLGCADGTKRACGCGTWEATWSVDGDVLTTRPEVTYSDPGSPPAGLPEPVRLDLR